MTNEDFCRYVDVFYGSGNTDRFFTEGPASKWFFIKALCGNTTPHAVLPFGKMSAGAYSGGYPTGYGTNYPNSCGGIRQLYDRPMARGFSHLHQSGTGGIRYYYNYAIACPTEGTLEDSFSMKPLTEETGVPGYYAAKIGSVFSEVTVSRDTALHRYTFPGTDGRVAVDFLTAGLSEAFGLQETPVKSDLLLVSDNEVLFSGVFAGIRLYFCVLALGRPKTRLFTNGCPVRSRHIASPALSGKAGADFFFESKRAELRVSFSTRNFEEARRQVRRASEGFDELQKQAYGIWNERLSVIRVETDDPALQEKFYSNLYHSLIKPADMTGETVLGVENDTVTGLATLWDQYKTLLPMIFLLYPDMGKKIAAGLENISKTRGMIPCSFGLADVFPCEEQAKMLGIYALCDAYHCGLTDEKTVTACTKRELAREDFRPFCEDGRFERYTHILDAADACAYVKEITADPELKERLETLSAQWKNAFDPDGLLSEASPYYEGDRYNYSFRWQHDMKARVALAGGPERFAGLLDDFFGFNGACTPTLSYVGAEKAISETHYHRFEGFNNESDMEAPYTYLAVGRRDRLNEIVHTCVRESFGLGPHGLPGNNDSGGLSSCFLWNALGLFPLSGSGEFFIGCPQFSRAELRLPGEKTLTILAGEAKDAAENRVAELNGEPVWGDRIAVSSLLAGGTLIIYRP